MSKLDTLKVVALFKELEYLNSEINWKEEYLSEQEVEFLKSVESILETNKELRELYNQSVEDKIENAREAIIDNQQPKEKEIIEKDKKIKKLYREIVKKTHPDKVDDEDLNIIYLEATDFYENNDIFSIYSICDQLNIKYELDVSEKESLGESINKLKGRIEFIENSYTWTWSNTEDEKTKEFLIMEYIKRQMNIK